ncbi:R3H domain-containing protein 1 [Linnemannia exigua]|uniref:R3H domain-containing protein 1 n=1 Tax=Linnemannia exigua TaxID=604196 RepID=A0AAD4D860_9FUNG|nr:R3H domain-containing protein 1 [Linnemannia exigua]
MAENAGDKASRPYFLAGKDPITTEPSSQTSTTEDQPASVQAKAPFTILKTIPPSAQQDPAAFTQTDDSSSSQEPVAKLTKALEGLEVDDDSNDTQDMALDEFLVNALKNRQERLFLLKLDQEFCSFINNPSQPQLEFPTLNGYYRMMVHKVANYFKLTRIVDASQKIILFKSDMSAIPPLRISDLAEEEDEQPVKMMKVLKRNPGRPSSGSATPDGSSEPERKPMSIKEREEAYAKARARIFQEDGPAKPKSPSENSELIVSTDSPSASTAGADSPKREGIDESPHGAKGNRITNGKKSAAGSRQAEDQDEREGRHPSLPNSRDVSRSTSPSPSVNISGCDPSVRQVGKGLRPKAKQSKTDLAAECADVRRRKSTTSNASSSSGTIKTPIGLARTISSSSSQDGFQSPNPGMPMTESPTVNSPSSATPSKGYDYFAANPNSNSGSVSPMSNGPRASYTYPQAGAHKQQRNYSGHPNHNGGGSGGMGYNNAQSNSGFMKGMNAPVFVPKKPYPKHGQINNLQNPNPYNNGPMPGYPTGPPNSTHAFNNNSNNSNNGSNHYTQQPHLNSSLPWSERSGPPGQDGPNFYAQQDPMHGNSSQSTPQGFNYSNAPNQYSQPGSSMHTSYNNQHQFPHHPSNNHPNNHHHTSQRGGRRGQPSQPYYQHHNHSRTHPQMHNSHQHPPHHGGNFNGPPIRDDFNYNQGPQSSMRYNRGFDGNPNHPSTQQYSPEFYPAHGMPIDPSNGPNMYPGFQGHQISPGEAPNGQRYPYNHKGPYDTNWGQGPAHSAGQGYDQSNTLYNPLAHPMQGGKKPYKNYHSVPPVNHQQFPSTMGGPQSVMSQAIPGVGSGGIGGNGAITHYDVERRPPKSAELFDPNGPQPSGGGSGGGGGGGGNQGDYGGSGRYQGSSDGGYMNSQDGSMMGGERQSQGHRGSFHGQYQAQSGPHFNQVTSQPTHAPIAMNRSYSSSSSSAGYSGGNTSSPGPHAGKKNPGLMYDYSVPTMPYDSGVKSTAEADKPPALGHILEIFGYDAQDDIFPDLVLPAGSKTRRLKAANKDVQGQVLVVFKNATLASEALSTFQEGKSTWMSPDAKLHFEASTSSDGSDGAGEVESEKKEEGSSVSAVTEADAEVETEGEVVPSTRLQRRFDVKIWTPVLVNSVTPLKATQPQLSGSPTNDSTNNNVGAGSSCASSRSNGTGDRSENGESKELEGASASSSAEAVLQKSSSSSSQSGAVILDESS